MGGPDLAHTPRQESQTVLPNPKPLSGWGQSPAPAVRATAGAGSAASKGHPRLACPLPGPLTFRVSLLSVDLPHLLQQLLIREAPEFPVIDREIVADMAAPPARPRRHLGPVPCRFGRLLPPPRLGTDERRTRTIGVRVTEAEAAELTKRAEAARLSMGAYMRRWGSWYGPRPSAD